MPSAISISSCGSPAPATSHTITRFPRRAATSARHAETVVFPTPPLPVTKTSLLSRRKATGTSEYSTPYGSLRAKDFQSDGLRAVSHPPRGRRSGARDPLGAARHGDLVRQPEGRGGQDHDDAESGGCVRGEGPPRAVRGPRSAIQPHDEPGHR